ncbi:Protein CBG00660 [Caenorhabditis briggsae]|uniref:Protein CBG00660 n=1 Tax=Caenorhabditis briggsae TaxID=6238 RepID=E3CTV4_CAEBR|nr:Protein CBG00660 [Caenorhabditis briggsae]CBX32990.1 Protein CBG00660 [Caenorhabditis briggsae]
MAWNNIFVSIVWQLFWASILYFVLEFGISVVRGAVPKIGHDERLFPRNIINNNDALNRHRVKIADGILQNLPQITQKSKNLEIRIVASNRGNDFLYQTVLFVLEQQSATFNYSLSICNVESEIFPDLRRFDKLKIPIKTIGEKSGEVSKNHLNSTIGKENQDYWKCLGLPTESRYILLIEDDAVVIPEFSKLLFSLVKMLDIHEYVDFAKLYHPNYLRKLPSYIMANGFRLYHYILLFLLLHCQILQNIPNFYIPHPLDFPFLESHILRFPADFRYYLTGSAYISYPESCCTPAVIFRQSSVKRMHEYFVRSQAFSGHAKDHILDESPFTGRQSDVNYVTHIGSFSSVRQRAVYLSDLREN